MNHPFLCNNPSANLEQGCGQTGSSLVREAEASPVFFKDMSYHAFAGADVEIDAVEGASAVGVNERNLVEADTHGLPCHTPCGARATSTARLRARLLRCPCSCRDGWR